MNETLRSYLLEIVKKQPNCAEKQWALDYLRPISQKSVLWHSSYQPGQKVLIMHYRQEVPAILVRKRKQPAYTWVCQKQIKGKWTKESIICNDEIIELYKEPS